MPRRCVRLVEVETPVALIMLPERIEVVDVRTFGVDDLAEQPVLGHIAVSYTHLKYKIVTASGGYEAIEKASKEAYKIT